MLAPAPEHDHAHHHGTGLPWLDIIVGLSAIFISVVSLIVSIEHGRTMEKMVTQNEKMVTANTLPFLTQADGMLDPETRKPAFRLTVRNGGVGPAIIDWFQFRYKDKAYGDLPSLLRACCATALPPPGHTGGIVYSNLSGTLMPARDTVDFIFFLPQADPALQASFQKARDDMSFSACYCSVLNECWQTDFKSSRPQSVSECHSPPRDQIW